MAKSTNSTKEILVYADWSDLKGPQIMGFLQADQVRGKEIFSFSYSKEWLEKGIAFLLDPELGLYEGLQYTREDKPNFGIFLDSSPDRWGRVLMERREAFLAKQKAIKPKPLLESDYLLGVSDFSRMGALRFKLSENGPFLNSNQDMVVPPMNSIRTLEEASLQLENIDSIGNPDFAHWLNLLLAPGSSLGGARPKASVIDTKGELWIAKFPSRNDDRDIGAWEMVANELAVKSGIMVATAMSEKFTSRFHTFLTKRFDRTTSGRIHFASAMTLLGEKDRVDSGSGISYLQLAEFIMRFGAATNSDLQELWSRIVFNICISNSDDHLRNHGFLLTTKGWRLSPAYDLNPIPFSNGLHLNINEFSNSLDLELAREVSEQFRINKIDREYIINRITTAVGQWHEVARQIGIPREEMLRMESTFLP